MTDVIFDYEPNKERKISELYDIDCILCYAEKMIDDGYLIPALTQVLLIPDICGQIEFNCKSEKRYADWFNKYVQKDYKITKEQKEEILNHLSEDDIISFIEFYNNSPCYFTGADCYSLRCNLMHTNISTISKYEPEKDIHCNKIKLKNSFSLYGFCLNSGECDIITPIPTYVSNHAVSPEDLYKDSDDKGPYPLRVSISIRRLCRNMIASYKKYKEHLGEEKLNELNENYEIILYKE